MRRFWLAEDSMNHSVQLLGISNAIVDVLAHVDGDFLKQIGAEPGSMTLIDRDRARERPSGLPGYTRCAPRPGRIRRRVAAYHADGGEAAQ